MLRQNGNVISLNKSADFRAPFDDVIASSDDVRTLLDDFYFWICLLSSIKFDKVMAVLAHHLRSFESPP